MKKIKLVCGDQELITTFEQAQAILQLQKATNGRMGKWQLDDPNYEFKDNGINKRDHKGSDQEKAASKGNRKGDKASKKTEVSHADSAE